MGKRTSGFATGCAIAAILVLLTLRWRLSLVGADDARLCEPRLHRFLRDVRVGGEAAALCGNGFTFLDDVLHLTDEQCVSHQCGVRGRRAAQPGFFYTRLYT